MKWHALLLLPAILSIGYGAQNDREAAVREQAIRQESQRVQGLWEFTSLRENGNDVAPAQLKDRTLFFSGDVFLLRQGEQLLQAGTLTLDPMKSPATASFTVMDGASRGAILLGIYELNGNSIRIALDPEGQKRPTEFKSDAGSGINLVVLQRVRSTNDTPLDIVGEYTSVGGGANGTSLTQDATIERFGDAYAVIWRRNNAITSQGIGILTDDVFSVSWLTGNQRGIAVYKVGKDRKLVGRYATFGAVGILVNETMTPKNR